MNRDIPEGYTKNYCISCEYSAPLVLWDELYKGINQTVLCPMTNSVIGSDRAISLCKLTKKKVIKWPTRKRSRT